MSLLSLPPLTLLFLSLYRLHLDMYPHLNIHTYMHMKDTCVNTQTHIQRYIHVCLHTFTQRAHMHTCRHIYLPIHIYTETYMHACMHIQTHRAQVTWLITESKEHVTYFSLLDKKQSSACASPVVWTEKYSLFLNRDLSGPSHQCSGLITMDKVPVPNNTSAVLSCKYVSLLPVINILHAFFYSNNMFRNQASVLKWLRVIWHRLEEVDLARRALFFF